METSWGGLPAVCQRLLSKPSSRVPAAGPGCRLLWPPLQAVLLGLAGSVCAEGTAVPGAAEPGAFRTLLQRAVALEQQKERCDPASSGAGDTSDCPSSELVTPGTTAASAGAAFGVVVGVLLVLGLVVVGTGYYYYKKDPEKFFNRYRNIFRRMKKGKPQTEPVNTDSSGRQLHYNVQAPTEVPVPVPMRSPGTQTRLMPVPISMQGGSAAPPWQTPYLPPETWSQVAPPKVVPPVHGQGIPTRSDQTFSSGVSSSPGVAFPPQPSMPTQQPLGATQWPQEYPGSAAGPWIHPNLGVAPTDGRPAAVPVLAGTTVADPLAAGQRPSPASPAAVQRPPLQPGSRAEHRDRDSSQHLQPLNYDIRVRPISNRPTALGSGAFGTVEAGVFTDEHGRHVHVAVKYGTGLFATKKPLEVAEIFRQELDVMRRVPVHPNIVLCYGGRVNFMPEDHIGQRDVYIVEELMHSNLHEVIHGDEFQGRMPFSLILKIALDIASGLEHLHRASIMHYDLKPANILVDENFRNAKIADFGISKVKAVSYITGTMRGTIGYMAPEILLSHFMRNMMVNEKIDVYSLGVVLWEMVEGKPPSNPMSFGNESLEAPNSAVSLTEDRFPITRPCPEPLKRLVDDCVSLEGGDRPTASAVRQRLHDLISANKKWTGSCPGVDG